MSKWCIVNELPKEISTTIFRYLDVQSLINAACVNRSWNELCRGDKVLRKKIFVRLRNIRRREEEAYHNLSKRKYSAENDFTICNLRCCFWDIEYLFNI